MTVLQQRGEGDALQAVAAMVQGSVMDLDMDLALSAAKVSMELKLPMADAVMLAAAQAHGATLWTQGANFEGIAGVQYIARRQNRGIYPQGRRDRSSVSSR